MPTDTLQLQAVAALRRARRSRRTDSLDHFELFYRTYIVALLGMVAVGVAASALGGSPLAQRATEDVVSRGPDVLALVAAGVVLVGARSGARGGPLGLEQADVRYLLEAPVPRGAVIRPLALRQLQALLVTAAATGSAAGLLAARRLPGGAPGWMAAGAAYGVGLALLAFGTACAASGTRMSRVMATLLGAAAVAWAAADLVTGSSTSPLAALATVGMWPIVPVPLGAAAGLVVVLLCVTTFGLRKIANLSVEDAGRRSKLVGEMRFAATLRDVRTVLVLHRQLSQDVPRPDPWADLRKQTTVRHPVWRRDWHGVLRWRSSRFVRMAQLGAVAGWCTAVAARGTVMLFLVGGAAFWIAALDAADAIGQEMDHPSLLESYPLWPRRVFVRHLPAAIVVMLLPALAAGVTANAFGPGGFNVAAVAAMTFAGAVTAVCGAMVTLVKGPPPPFDPLDLITAPEVASMRKLQQLLLPILMASAALGVRTAASAVSISIIVAGGTLIWLRVRESTLLHRLLSALTRIVGRV
ncbi:MAG: hypothetical protein QOK43_2231 [Acidimicrobiaceae bacterium]|nr:hypothetical protein [Acidimicrobiaceae bacterium]